MEAAEDSAAPGPDAPPAVEGDPAVVALLASLAATPVLAQGTLRIGMTASDIPLTTGQTDNGGEGMRFMGYTLYDGLINWDLSSADKASVLVPGLATSWKVDEADPTRWTFTLRDGVKFHDGSAFNADAVIWNFDKVFDTKAPQFDQRQASQVRPRLPSVAGYRKIDDMTVEVKTKVVDALFPYQMLWFLVSSPAQFEKLGKDWNKFAQTPSGTGPWKLTAFQPQTRAELSPNKDYWDKARVPKLDKMVLLPIPEPATRTAALRSGQVDWIEAPAPDAVAQIKSRGFEVYANAQPHMWPWQLSFAPGSPWLDKRVRQAANLCVNREGLKTLLGGYMAESKGIVEKGNPWWGNPTFDIKYDANAARKLRRQAPEILFRHALADDDAAPQIARAVLFDGKICLRRARPPSRGS